MEPLEFVNALSAVVSAVAAVVSAAVSVLTLSAQRRAAESQHLRREENAPPMDGTWTGKLPAPVALSPVPA